MNVAMELFPKAIILEGLLKDFPKHIKQIAFSELDRIARKAHKRVKSLTPGKALPRGWVIEKSGNAFYRTRTLRNKDPRASKTVALKSGGTTNLLEMMEFGTSPHVIVPVRSSVLRFVSREGDTVYTKRVNHPGTQAYGMVSITYAEAAEGIAKLQLRLASEIRNGLKK